VSKKFWTDEQIALLKSDETNREIAKKVGRSFEAVRQKRGQLGLLKPRAAAIERTYEEDRESASADLWRKRYNELAAKYKRAQHENSVVDQLVSEIRDLAPTSYTSAPAIRNVRPRAKSQSQSAVLLFSDTHVGKVVLPEQTLGFGRYDFPTFLAMLKYQEESIISILENHTTMQIDELVVCMLGDALDGALLHGVEAGQRNTLFSQFYNAGHAIAQSLRILAAHVPGVRVKTVVGNHTRWANQKRMPTENRYSNLDMFLYALVEALTKDIKNIQWDLNTQPFSIFEVQGFVFHASHGDHLRGGDKALGIPNHAVGRQISTTTQLFMKHGKRAPNYYVCGHLHRDIKLPHALGSVMINGGYPGLDNYSLAESFNPTDPMQRFFFVHPKYGVTAQYELSLKFAEVGDAPPYTLPGNFSIQ
jgi:hypothetical protein